jgi:hypothetical protein
VQATVLYQRGIVNFYHGFDQPKILDRQEMRLQFEHGEITLYEWVPVRMTLHGLLLTEQLKKISEQLVKFTIDHHKELPKTMKVVRGRFSDIPFNEHVTIDYGNVSEKQERYQEMLVAMITDQWNWIKDRKHVRVIDDSNAIQSLRMAEESQRMVQLIAN